MLLSLKQRNWQGPDHCRHLWLKTVSYCRKRSQFDNGTNFTEICLSGGYLFTELGFRDGFRGEFGVGIFESPHVRDGLGFWIPRCGFPDSSTGFLIF